MKKLHFISFIIIGFLPFTLKCEDSFSILLKVARFRTNQHAEDLPKYTVGPEIEIESKLIHLKGDTVFTSASIYSSIWDDFVRQPTELWSSNATWSSTCIGSGVRLKMWIKWIRKFSIQGFCGLSHYYVYYDYIGGSSEFSTKDYDKKEWFQELGVNLGIQIAKKTRLIAEYSYLNQFQSIGSGDEKQNIKVGILYFIK